jgi:hypothetical protein
MIMTASPNLKWGSQLSFSSKQANDASHRFNDFGVHLYNAHSAFLWRKFSNEATGDDREGDQPMRSLRCGCARRRTAGDRRRSCMSLEE